MRVFMRASTQRLETHRAPIACGNWAVVVGDTTSPKRDAAAAHLGPFRQGAAQDRRASQRGEARLVRAAKWRIQPVARQVRMLVSHWGSEFWDQQAGVVN